MEGPPVTPTVARTAWRPVDQDLFAKAMVLEDKSGHRVAVVNLDCNGYFGYIPSNRILEEGGYEADGWKTPSRNRSSPKRGLAVGKKP